MKYALLVGDGMADFALSQLDGKTPLDYARTPHMDSIAAVGQIGRVITVPEGLPAGSDVANMALMGYDPQVYYSGRAPIEAASMGIVLGPDATAFRCNLVTLANDTMADYSAGHIDTESARELIESLGRELNIPGGALYPGISYRHLFVYTGFDTTDLLTTPPHDISGQPFMPHVPTGGQGGQLVSLMKQAREILAHAPANKRRVAQGLLPATDIWLWGQGHSMTFPSMADRFGSSGTVVSAVDLVKGLGVLAGLGVAAVDGATGYLGTNYAGKVKTAFDALDTQDFVYVHVEAPDETSHEGSLDKKIQAIEEFDEHVVGPFVQRARERGDWRILVAPDHATPVETRTHHAMPVPFCVCGPGIESGNSMCYCESVTRGEVPYAAVNLFVEFMRGSFDKQERLSITPVCPD